MIEHPILFSAQMVRAILDGSKIQTRRVLSPANSLMNGSPCPSKDWERLDWNDAFVDSGPSPAGNPGPYLKAARPEDETRHRIYSRKQPGDRLWVREGFRLLDTFDNDSPSRVGELCLEAGYRKPWAPVQFEADSSKCNWVQVGTPGSGPPAAGKFRPGIHMPRWASRVSLEITDVRLERLQAISGKDAASEGAPKLACYGPECPAGPDACSARGCFGAREWFADLWAEINGAGSWNANPWVWVISFERLQP